MSEEKKTQGERALLCPFLRMSSPFLSQTLYRCYSAPDMFARQRQCDDTKQGLQSFG